MSLHLSEKNVSKKFFLVDIRGHFDVLYMIQYDIIMRGLSPDVSARLEIVQKNYQNDKKQREETS